MTMTSAHAPTSTRAGADADLSVVVICGEEVGPLLTSLESIAASASASPELDVAVVLVGDPEGLAGAAAQAVSGARVTVVPGTGGSRWADFSAGLASTSPDSAKLTISAGEVLASDAAAGAVVAERRRMLDRELPGQLASIGLSFPSGAEVHEDTVFEGHSTFHDYVHNERPARFGAFSYSGSYIPRNVVEIGRYTSIGPEVVFGAAEHPVDQLTTSPFPYHDHTPFGGVWSAAGLAPRLAPALSDAEIFRDIRIGNDVWIGTRAYIRGGVTLGDGCIVAAGAIVTRDVPPYAVVAGSPARVVKHRFAADLVDELLELRWWQHDVISLSVLDTQDVRGSAQAIRAMRAAGELVPWSGEQRPLRTAFPATRWMSQPWRRRPW